MMISRYDVALNGVHMNELNENLLILDVSHDQPKIQLDTVPIAGKDGLTISRKHRETASVTVTFELHIYGIADRQKALEDVIQWAKNGGVLTTNDREGQRLVCVCDGYPSITSVKRWTDTLAIVFTAYQNPYWESDEPSAITLSGRNTSGRMEIPGNAGDCFVSCSITARATLTSVHVSAGNSFIELSGLSIPANGVIQIGYTDGVLSIKHGNTSLLNKRTANSSDDLIVPSGQESAFSVSASASVQVTFSARGCWM